MIIVTKKKATKKKSTKKKAAKKNTPLTGQTGKKAERDPAQKKTPPEVVPMPTAGHKVKEFEDKLDASFLDAEETPKRGRGRPRKETGQPEPEIDVKVIGQAIQIPFDLWAISQDLPELKISIEEAILIAKPAKAIVDHYLPVLPDIAWAWFSLTAVSYSIIKTRLVLIAEIKKTKTSSERPAGEKDVPDSRGQGRPRSAAFPSFDEIKKPVR